MVHTSFEVLLPLKLHVQHQCPASAAELSLSSPLYQQSKHHRVALLKLNKVSEGTYIAHIKANAGSDMESEHFNLICYLIQY